MYEIVRKEYIEYDEILESDRLEHYVKFIETRVFIDSLLKESFKTWLDVIENEVIVSVIIDMYHDNLHIERIDAYRKGSGYAGETLSIIFNELGKTGQISTAYIEKDNYPSERMFKKLGFSIKTHRLHGNDWFKIL